MDTDASRLSGALADRYRVERELGSGGMATVYLARDVRHDREVAIKVLRADIAAAIGVDRFLAEIKTTAHLQHPNILGLIDSGEVNGSVFYVMPFVRGGSLRARLEREQQLPVADAVRIATQVANALQYAHKSGVIHRDIKPENILLHEEQALVADFGIALAVTRSQSGKRVTEAGTSLGTPEYMSPEQAMGERTLDARADIYALGCVLYEMLAGEPPFRGPSAQAVIAKVMTVEPERISALRKSVPRNVAAATMMALQKVPADRFANAAEFAAALGNPQFVAPALGDRTVQTSAVMERRNVGMVAAIGVLAIVGAFGWLRQTGTPTNPVVRFEIASDPTMGGQVTLSHDGSRLLWSAGNAYWERRLDTLGSHRLRDAAMPQSGIRDIDKNGRDVLLSGRGGLAIASLAAGPARVITGGGVGRGGAALGFDRYVYVSANQSHAIARVPRDSGAVEVLADAPDSTTIMEIVALPGGHGLIASLSKNGIPSIAAFDLGAKTWKPLGSGGPQIRFVPPEYVLFASGSYLMAAAIDTKSLAFRQPAVPYVEASSDISMLATSATVLAYRAGLDVGDVGIEVRTLGGTAPRTLANVSDSLRFSSFSVSPDGRRFAATGTPIPTPGSSVQAVSNIWVYELPAGPMSRLPSSLRANYPAWMPGGKDISYAQFSADTPFTSALMRRSFDGLTTPVTIVTRTADSGLVACASWFPTGGRALIQVGGGGCGGLQGRGGGGG
ncbi:MAG TPA: serine/threonine-protein kinase, partial [Gemmatimonadaceae bacterium]|nr:serine/threonine-protein kinase [Gemmatimonadaceae bacterium]